MLMIVAALEEELKKAMDLAGEIEKVQTPSGQMWRTAAPGSVISFLKTGMGPTRAAASLDAALAIVRPDRILAIGYGGGLDPSLNLGDLVAIRRVLSFSTRPDRPGWEHGQVDEAFQLADAEDIIRKTSASGLNVCIGDAITTAHILGKPEHKSLIYRKFGVSIVDMETAAWARVAANLGIPFSCVRVISDDARDTFLSPFSYDPSTGVPARALKLMSKGIGTYREWKERSLKAGDSLQLFLSRYFSGVAGMKEEQMT